MLMEKVVEHCAPTLAGIKTGNIFSIKNAREGKNLNSEIRELNSVLTKKGLRLIPVRRTDRTTLFYLYRPDNLKEDLKCPEAREILSEKGYPLGNCDCCIVELVRHLKKDESFPHEIGLFLGYPPEDVIGFIENRAAKSKCVGCWKVYGDVEKAEAAFRKFKKCTGIYCRKFAEGTGIEKLAVNI